MAVPTHQPHETSGAERPSSGGAQPRKHFATAIVAWAARTIESIDPSLTPRFLFGFVGFLLLAAIALVILLRSEGAMEPVTVRLAGPVSTAANRPPPDTVRIAVSSAWAFSDRFEHFDALRRYVSARIERPVVIVQRRTDGEILEILATGDVQAAVLCTGAYLRARRQGMLVEPLAVPVFDRAPTVRALVIARSDSDIRAMADLRGRSIALTDPTSLPGYYDPLATILDQGDEPSAFFARTVFTYDAGASLRAVRNGSVDAAAIDEHTFEREVSRSPRNRRGDLRIVRRSPPYGVGPLVVAPGTSDDLRIAVTDAALGMRESAEGRALLRVLHVDRFVEPPDDLYDSATTVVDYVERHGQRSLP